MKLILTVGLPASGKTTWARKFVEDNPEYVRVSRDDLRSMRGKCWIPDQEDLISYWETACVRYALMTGHSVVLDATNLNQENVDKWRWCAKNDEADFELKEFLGVPLSTCIDRDKKRENPVGEKVIRGMFDKYDLK